MAATPWGDTLALIGVIIGALGAVGVAVVYLLSRVQREYVRQLKESRDEALRENQQLHRELSELRGAVRVLQGMAMGKCPRFVLDPVTGGCGHCDLGLLYGRQRGPQEEGV